MRKRIGEYFVQRGILTDEQVELVLRYSQRTGLRFGEAGVELSLLTREKLLELFGPSFQVDFFHVDPAHFPDATKEALVVDAILSCGVLPLGFKQERGLFGSRKVLNLGFLNPADAEAVREAENAARAKLGPNAFQGVKVFLVLADQFLETLEKVYGIGARELRELEPSRLHETLQLFMAGTVFRDRPAEEGGAPC
jgi:hypothetical protein